jgi:hypothetical protein
MNFNWTGNIENSSGIAEFKLQGWPTVKLEMDSFTDAVALSNLMDQFRQAGIKEGQTRLLDALHFDLRLSRARDAIDGDGK